MLKDFTTEYRQKLCTPEEAVEVVKSGDWVDYTSSLGKPVLLDRALAKRRDELFDVKIRGNLMEGPIEVAECDESQEHFVYHTWHCSAYERKLCDRGLCYYIPMVFHNNAAYYKYFLNVNVVMDSVSPMDKHGYFNYSVNTGVAGPIVQNADIVIVEVNEHMPKIHGGYGECIHVSEVDYIVEGRHEPITTVRRYAPTETDRKIVQNILPYICDGSTLQLGIEVCRMQLVNCLRNQILRILACILNFAQMRTCIYIKQGSLPIKRRQSIRVRVYLVWLLVRQNCMNG